MDWTLAPALKVLLAEVNAAHPDRDKRTDGTISGYPGARSSHNYNSAGFVCALDITTGNYPGGISGAQGQALAEQVRLALKNQPRGIPAYPIHYMAPPYVPTPGAYIATAGTNWEWEPYGFPGSDPHISHLHISADWDIYTGQAPSGLADYMTTAPWGIFNLSGQGSGITPIQEDTLSVAEVEQIIKAVERERITIVNEVRAHTLHNANRVGDRVGVEAYETKVFAQKVMNENGDRIIHDDRAQIAGLTEVVKQLAHGGGTEIDLDKVFEAAKRGAEQAIAEGVVQVDINIAKPDATAAEVAS